VAEDDGEVVGHVVCTRGHVAGRPALGLGPVSVLPDRQGTGVGSALMRAVLAAAEARGEALVALVGDPGYYRRFGFRPAADLGVLAPDPTWGDYFQALPLTAWSADLRGEFRYAEPFTDVGG
jgi:putative acetyltransferase